MYKPKQGDDTHAGVVSIFIHKQKGITDLPSVWKGAAVEKLVIEHFEDSLRKHECFNERKIRELPKGVEGRLPEIGCGARLTYAPRTIEACGVDISMKMAGHFIKNHPHTQMVVADAKALPFHKKFFNVVVMNTVIHHLVGKTPGESLDKIAIALREVRCILKSSGMVLIIELLARNYAFSLLMFYATTLCAKLGIEIDLLDINSRVVTFFLTDAVLRQVTSKIGFTTEELESSY